jgi:hypothetical protein
MLTARAQVTLIAAFLLSFCLHAQGAISLHPENPHYFLFRGKSTVLITSAEHYGAVMNRDFNYVAYLGELASKQLNMTRIFSGNYVESWGGSLNTLNPAPGRLITPWARSSTPGYADGGNKFNLDVFDSAYWSRLRDFVQQASNRGIVVEYVLFCTSYDSNDWPMSPFNAVNNINGLVSTAGEQWNVGNARMMAYEDAFVRKAVTELNGFDNVTFELCNEPYMRTGPRRSGPWDDHIAQVIATTENGLPNRHLIAQGIGDGDVAVGEPIPNVSIYNFHYSFPPTVVATNYALNRPIAFDETGFRGSDQNLYRQEAWAFLLNGGAVYDALDWSFTVASPIGGSTTFSVNNGSRGATLRSWLQILKNFMGSIDFVHMTRNPGIIVGGNPGSAWALSKSNAVAVYLLGGTQANLVLNLPASSSWRAEWVDTKTGGVVRTETFSHGGGNRTIASPTYSQDIALRLTTTTGGTNTPPSVSLTSPANGSTFTAPATITLTANASDSNGVSKVDFYRNGTWIGTDTASPYSFTLSGVAAGSYSLSANATDNLGALGSSNSVSVTVSGGGTQTNGASFVSQSIPTSMTTGQSYSVSVTMQNSGTKTWTASGGYKLGSQNPQDNSRWGMHRVDLASGDAIAAGQSKTFTFNVQAPTPAGTYNFQWRMVQEGVMWFGGFSTNVAVTVGGSTGGGVIGTGTGLTGQYFDNKDLTGASVSRTDATVNFTWGLGSPASSIAVDTFSARWTGQVQAQHTQTYTFYVTSDDGARLWVNGVQIINKWIDQSSTEWSGSIALTAGTKYDIKLEYFENGVDAAAQLRWSSASTAKSIIPSSQLYPASTGGGGGTAVAKAVNVNGPQLIINGVTFFAESASGMTLSGGSRVVLSSGLVSPATSAEQKQLLSTSYWNSSGTMNAGLPLANGSYRIYLHTWEDNYAMDFQLAFEGQAMGGTQSTGAANTWKRIGPYEVTVGDGNLSIRATGGHFMLSGIEAYVSPTIPVSSG